MTVGELRDALRKIPPSTLVFLDDADGSPELVSVDFVDGQVWLEFEDALSVASRS